MNYIKLTAYVSGIILLLYFLQVTVVVEFIDSFKGTWNYSIYYVTTFRYRQPVLFLFLPLIAVWMLGKK